MSVIHLKTLGRWGNQLFQYAYARSYAEQYGATLYTDDWLGRKVFSLNDPLLPNNNSDLPARVGDVGLDGELDIRIGGYCQTQACMIYSRDQARSWFSFRPEIQHLLNRVGLATTVAHRRVGDYCNNHEYVEVSVESYVAACEKYGVDPNNLTWVTEDYPWNMWELRSMGLGFLPDFYRIMNGTIIFRGNSAFSWWAAALSRTDDVYSPVIDGFSGGLQTVPFVRGNHPKFTVNYGVEDLRLS